MGRRGPPPQPTKLRLLEGNPGHRAINRREPQPTPGAPTMPLHLNRAERRVWRTTVVELSRLGLLTQVDGYGLACFCTACIEYIEMKALIRKSGHIYRLPTGEFKANPAWAMMQKAMHAVRVLGAEFGLSPSARSRLSLPGRVEEDELAALLNDAG